MTRHIAFTGQARHDMDEIWVYIAEDNVAAADGLIDEFHQATRTLADNPELGRSRQDLSDGLRGLHVGNYMILYRPQGDGIIVIRVLHGARDLPEMF
ncbi:MAG: type II toxin-antitoxin system RelE/ParE family toxin [bacterium]|nr:type II toxin-antitoxin system RelE/ParE family toxin [bacterium]